MSQLQYKFYSTLLDKYESYINSSRVYQEYWGFSENPSKTEEEFEKEQFQGLIDTINRIPFESEAADRGTAFNEVVDCIIENRKSDKMIISSNEEDDNINVKYKDWSFDFSLSLCREFSTYFKNALTQQYTQGILPTKYGDVQLYGYIDELLPFKVADIKTTSKYNAFKYKNNWQHKVYPFCLNQNGIPVNDFEYTITDFKSTWTELYVYNSDRDIPLLVEHCERLIEFVEENKSKIINKKIFGLE